MTHPLSSLKILDFSTLLPGPFATMMLADLGADVVRVEAPHRPDAVRCLPPFDGEMSTLHGVLNRNKCSIALVMKLPEAVDIIKRLVTVSSRWAVPSSFQAVNRNIGGWERPLVLTLSRFCKKPGIIKLKFRRCKRRAYLARNCGFYIVAYFV